MMMMAAALRHSKDKNIMHYHSGNMDLLMSLIYSSSISVRSIYQPAAQMPCKYSSSMSGDKQMHIEGSNGSQAQSLGGRRGLLSCRRRRLELPPNAVRLRRSKGTAAAAFIQPQKQPGRLFCFRAAIKFQI